MGNNKAKFYGIITIVNNKKIFQHHRVMFYMHCWMCFELGRKNIKYSRKFVSFRVPPDHKYSHFSLIAKICKSRNDSTQESAQNVNKAHIKQKSGEKVIIVKK